jgi:23S rRNA pseudouridine955/2504/2580 synthase
MQKRYLAVVVGVPQPREGLINLPLSKGSSAQGFEKMCVDEQNGQKSISRYKVLDYAHDKASLVELEPITGRTHQLRVHMAHIGYPIMGDGKYGGKVSFMAQESNGLHLHAWQLILPMKGNKHVLKLEASIPEHMIKTMQFLGLSTD